MTGIVLNVQRYSLHDGPGIRTVVFLKGCPLRCLWCCNPESQRFEPEVAFMETFCQHCGRCVPACPRQAVNSDVWSPARSKIDRQRCDGCGRCVEVCSNAALRIQGQRRSVKEVLDEVLLDAAFYRRSGGGVTLSGGEPMAQPDFAAALLKVCYERNVHTAIETTGCAAWPSYEKILPYTQLFLYDLKQMDDRAHRRLTGVPNGQIVENARRLAGAGATIILRVPLVPGYNLEGTSLRAVADLAVDLGVHEVQLMPFHQLGKGKYGQIGRAYELEGLSGLKDAPDYDQSIGWAQQIMSRRGLLTAVGG